VRLVIASNNAAKRREIESILGPLGITVVPASDTVFVPVREDGESFAANARKKAEAFMRANGLPAIADDSGLCVQALDGAPGVHSSRFAGEGADDAANMARLLQALRGVRDRRAYFICCVHLAFPDGRVLTATGKVEGRILEQPDGEGGFGYDPVFHCPEIGKSFARASAEEKAKVSHRGRALRELARMLQAVVGESRTGG